MLRKKKIVLHMIHKILSILNGENFSRGARYTLTVALQLFFLVFVRKKLKVGESRLNPKLHIYIFQYKCMYFHGSII